MKAQLSETASSVMGGSDNEADYLLPGWITSATSMAACRVGCPVQWLRKSLLLWELTPLLKRKRAHHSTSCSPLHTHFSLQCGDSEILLEDGGKSIFHYVQLLHSSQQHRPDKLRKVWDNTYTLVYQDRTTVSSRGWSLQYVSRHLGTDRLPKGEVIQYLQKRAKVLVELN